jgi:hypothetical protein
MRLSEIVERVTLLGKQNQLLCRRGHGRRDGPPVRGRQARQGVRRERSRPEQLAEKTRQLAPLRILSAPAHASRQPLEPIQRDDFQLQQPVPNARLAACPHPSAWT